MSEHDGANIDTTKVVGRPKAFLRKDRKAKPYGVRYRFEGGKYIRRFFETPDQRSEFMAELRSGSSLGSFDAIEWQRWLHIKHTCERLGVSPESAIAQWQTFARAKVTVAPPLGELVDQYIATKGNKSKDYRQHLEAVLKRQLVPVFGADKNIAAIARPDLQKWLDSGNKHAMTYRNHRAYVRGLMIWAKEQGYIAEVLQTRAPDIKAETPEALTADQAVALFAANAHLPEVAAALALAAFAGIRAASIARIEAAEIRVAEKQIYLPAEKFKTGRAHLIEGAPENLWVWLARADLDDLCSWSERKHRHELTNAYKRADITPPKNALRHSFATYKCALDGSAEKASYILGHTNPAEIWQSYKGIATKADAERYFAILPTR